jgi:hypothetical protein
MKGLGAIGARDMIFVGAALQDSILCSVPFQVSILGGAALQDSILCSVPFQVSILGGAALQRCDHIASLSTALAAEVAQ